MADMFTATTTCSSSSPPPNAPPPEQDDISRFLHQILLRSSSTSSSQAFAPHKTQSHSPPHIPPENQHQTIRLPVSDRISSGLGVFSPTGAYIPTVAPNVSSSSAGTIDNDPEEYDCESEEGFENLGEEMAAKPSSQRNPSKRSRAAEVHNLSEKRRRSRINEKMKALQKLIPNSNKTDKASMLDEAIEYLKQLQLQVQMLTMRNGLSLYPMCPPGALQPNQIRMGFNEENGSINMNMTGPISQNQGTTLANTLLNNLPIQCTNPNNPSQPSLSDFTNIISSETFRLGSSIPSQHGPFQFHKSSEDICTEGLLPHPQIDVDHNHRLNSSEFRMGAKASVTGRDRQESLQQMNSESGTILSTRLDG